MKKFLLTILFFAAIIINAAEPVMKIGIVSDTHVTPEKSSCKVLKEALSLFRQHKVDVIANVGDIADHYYEKGYHHYRNTINEVFSGAEKKPQEIFVYANHDWIDRKKESFRDVFKDVKKHLGIPHQFNDFLRINGYTIAIIPQYISKEEYISIIKQTVKENKGKPAIIFDHVPPFDTVYNSRTWGNTMRREILNNYPSVVQISGHIHNTLTNELSIWQDKFTVVDAGTLYTSGWDGSLVGNPQGSTRSDMALIMEVFKDKLVFRRFFAKNKEEYKPDAPWIVPLPFDPETAPYTPENRMKKSKAPQFRSDAIVRHFENQSRIRIAFPNIDNVFIYRMEFSRKEEGRWVKYARKDILSEFMKPVSERAKWMRPDFNYGYFDSNTAYRVEITPVNFFGQEGKALNYEFSTGDIPENEVVFESRDPMNECLFLRGLHFSKKNIPFNKDKNGFYIHDEHNGRLVFPENIWKGEKNTYFRIIAEMHTIQSAKKQWTIVMRDKTFNENGNARLATPAGNSGIQRVVIDFRKKHRDYNFYMLIREGLKGKIKFNYIRIEKLK